VAGAVGTAVAFCVAYLILRPPSQDFAVGDFRARLFRQGVFIWNNHWFAGHSLPGYGLVGPMLGAAFGVTTVAMASVLLGSWSFGLLAERWHDEHPELPHPALGAALFAAGTAVNLWGGRIAFGAATAFGTACVLAIQRRRRGLIVVSAVACSLCSPLGALSLGIILAACYLCRALPRRLLWAAAAATVVPIGIITVLFPEGGWFPFTAGSFVLLAVCLAVVGWSGWDQPVIRWLVALYGVVALGAFVVRSPLGGNVVRLGWLGAAPAGALLIRRYRRLLVPAFSAFCLVWSWAYVKIAFLPRDISSAAAFYQPLAQHLDQSRTQVRVEVVPTQTFRQADELALEINLARGWERQVDRALNPLFYASHLDAATYHRWLLDNSVAYVALPLGRIQDQSRTEADLVRSAPGYLQLVWADADWKLYRVADAEPLADHGSTVTAVGAESLTVQTTRTGWSEVRFRYTRLYRVTSGQACLTRSSAGWIRMYVARPGTVRLGISLRPANLVGAAPQCAPAGA
jgi:hypothetical protein